jgi:hypothetical protein
MYEVLCVFFLIIGVIALLFVKLEKKLVDLSKVIKTELYQEIELAKVVSDKDIREDVCDMSFRDKIKHEYAREICEQNEAMKTELEIMYYNLYVLEKKKNMDFPEEKKRACEILPLINLSIADKIDVGRILFHHHFNSKFPLLAPSGYRSVNVCKKLYMENKNMYIQFTRYQFSTHSVVLHTYNITLNTYTEEPPFDILHCLSSIYQLPDASLEKERIENRNKILHAMEQP